MSTPDRRRDPSLVILCAATLVLAASGCGRTGISGLGTAPDGNVTSSGGAGQGGSGGLGETSSLGGTIASAGRSGQGGASKLGGSKASGGASALQSGSVVSPRVPKTHRAQARSCAGTFAPAEPVNPQRGDCKKHADCTKGTNGRCITVSMSTGRVDYELYICTYDGCAIDDDCDPGKVCHCTGEQAPRCLSVGNCQIDADCLGGAVSYCSPAFGHDCGGYHVLSGYYCHTPSDTCIDDSDCTGKEYCDYDVIDGRWECKSPDMTCVVG